jgi:hypothetical protein
MEDVDGERTALIEHLTIDPSDGGAWLRLIDLDPELPDEAANQPLLLELLRAGAAAERLATVSDMTATMTLAWALITGGNRQEAITWLERASCDDEPYRQWMLADAYFFSGRTRAALDALTMSGGYLDSTPWSGTKSPSTIAPGQTVTFEDLVRVAAQILKEP